MKTALQHCTTLLLQTDQMCTHTKYQQFAQNGVQFHFGFDLFPVQTWLLTACTAYLQPFCTARHGLPSTCVFMLPLQAYAAWCACACTPASLCFIGLLGSSAGMPSGSSASASSSGNGQTYTSTGQSGAMSMSSSSGDAAHHLTDRVHIMRKHPCVCASVCTILLLLRLAWRLVVLTRTQCAVTMHVRQCMYR